MYVKRVRIMNYGPIEALDIEFPFDGDKPKPVVLVGPNGSGKSVLLSNIVNGLLYAQSEAYPESPEVEQGKVYKLRSPQYVTSGKEYSFTQVNFMDLSPVRELNLIKQKRDFDQMPAGIEGTDAQNIYEGLPPEEISILKTGFDQQAALRFLGQGCALYFPPSRFEDPAWLNHDNLTATAQYMDLKHFEGHSNRQIVNYSPLRRNQNWLFEVFYDFMFFEFRQKSISFFETRKEFLQSMDIQQSEATKETLENLLSQPSPSFLKGLSHMIRSEFFQCFLNDLVNSINTTGSNYRLYDAANRILRNILCSNDELLLSVGQRRSRMVSVAVDRKILVPNIFQLSSGEVSLLNLFLSILRDYDLTGAEFTSTEEIRGIVIVDEIDLHLHTVHQHEVLLKLMVMFPKIQFIVTSHSPLFVLGLQQLLGEEGFGLYELPSGMPILAEDFEEFGEAYRAFSKTRQHSREVQSAIKNAQKPLVFVEGTIDVRYLQRAAALLEFQDLMEVAEIRAGGGSSQLDKIWNKLTKDHIERKSIIILYDPECSRKEIAEQNIFRRLITKFTDHPIQKGIENLFDRESLERARRERPAFIDVTGERRDMVRGEEKVIPETWKVNNDEKTNLCNWLCENGTADDFDHFKPTLEILRDLLVEDTTGDVS